MDENELLAFITRLPDVSGYSAKERYDDFRLVFGTDQGQRVMAEILAWGKLFRMPHLGNPVDSNKNLIITGERNMAIKLIAAYNVEPGQQPDRQEKA